MNRIYSGMLKSFRTRNFLRSTKSSFCCKQTHPLLLEKSETDPGAVSDHSGASRADNDPGPFPMDPPAGSLPAPEYIFRVKLQSDGVHGSFYSKRAHPGCILARDYRHQCI